jgi:hypothetical protein
MIRSLWSTSETGSSQRLQTESPDLQDLNSGQLCKHTVNLDLARRVRKVLRYGLSGRSTGVVMFTIRSVAEDSGKMAAMKRVYSGHTYWTG